MAVQMFLLAILLRDVLAQEGPDLLVTSDPSCAGPCFTSVILAAGCALTDLSCQCGTGPVALGIANTVLGCLLTECDSSDLSAVLSDGSAVCSSYSSSIANVSATTTSSTPIGPTQRHGPIAPTSTAQTLNNSFSTSFAFISISEPSGLTTVSISPSPSIVAVTATPSPSRSRSELSTGAKAGIGVGVMLSALVLIALVIKLLWYRRHRHHAQTETGQKACTEPKPNTHEMITDSNRHELLTKSNVHEMEQEKQGVLSAPKELQGQLTEKHELNPNSHILGLELHSDGYPSLHELETTSTPAIATNTIISDPRTQVPRNEIAEEEDDEGMRILQDRIERIRGEKERLQKIHELELLEEETKRAILEKARRRGGGAIGSGNGNS